MNENEKLREIIRLGAELNNVQDVDILLERILYEARTFVDADAGTIYVRQGDHLVFSHAQNDTKQRELPPGDKLIYSTFSVPLNLRSIAGYVATTGEILNIPDVYQIAGDAPYQFSSDYDKRSNYKTTSMLTVPLKTERGDIIGVLQIINAMDQNKQLVSFDKEDELYVFHFATTASMVLQKAQMTRTLLLRMIQMAEMRDPKETGAHVNRVGAYSVAIYERWAHNHKLPQEQVDREKDVLRMAAMLHDAGKVAISDLILKKPARFTEEEYDIMKSHTYLGSRIFKDKESYFDEVAADIALTHHENWDGTGYPGRVDLDTGEALKKNAEGGVQLLKGEEISIYGRIVALADVYDALSSKRVYKDAWDENSVLDEIRKLSGTKFDPLIVDAFFESLDEIGAITARYPDKD
ncbi:MAG: HD domain-containing protein [bacterium]|nr:HD domain-containing protein [bacterium]